MSSFWVPVLAAANELPLPSATLFPLCWEREQGQGCLRHKERDENKQQTSKLSLCFHIFLSEIVSEPAYLFIYLLFLFFIYSFKKSLI